MCEDFFEKVPADRLGDGWIGQGGDRNGRFLSTRGGRGCAKRGLRQGSPFHISYLQIRLMM